MYNTSKNIRDPRIQSNIPIPERKVRCKEVRSYLQYDKLCNYQKHHNRKRDHNRGNNCSFEIINFQSQLIKGHFGFFVNNEALGTQVLQEISKSEEYGKSEIGKNKNIQTIPKIIIIIYFHHLKYSLLFHNN